MPTRVRVAVLDDADLVAAGTARLLEPFSDRVEVVALDSTRLGHAAVDVVLYDPTHRDPRSALHVSAVCRQVDATLLLFGWQPDARDVGRELAGATAGFLSKSATAEELLDAVLRVHDGLEVMPPSATAAAARGSGAGSRHGLTAREHEILTLICQGLSNHEIASRCFLSINSIKTHVRTTYRKVGVNRRADAVRWGIEHGLLDLQAPGRPEAVEARPR